MRILEERILEYLITKSSAERKEIILSFDGVVVFDDIDENRLCNAVRDLEKQNYVQYIGSADGVSVFLNEAGRNYFEEEYGDYQDEIEKVLNFINRIARKHDITDEKEAESLIRNILATYIKEIPQKLGTRINIAFSYGQNLESMYGDMENLSNILENVYTQLKKESKSTQQQGGITVNVIQSQTQSQTQTITIKIENVIEQLQQSQFSQEDIETIRRILEDIERPNHSRQSRWEKIKSALKFVIEKGLEVGIAVLPFISQFIGK